MSVKPDKRKSAAFHRDQSGRHAVRMLDCVKADWSNFAPSKGLQHRSGKFRVEFHVGACPIRHVENVTAAQQISLYFRKRYRVKIFLDSGFSTRKFKRRNQLLLSRQNFLAEIGRAHV